MVKKYKDSFETRSESLALGGRGIITAVENEDTHTTFQKALPPEFDAPRHTGNLSSIRTLADDLQSAVKGGKVSLASQALSVPKKQKAPAERPVETITNRTSKKRAGARASRSYLIIIALVLIIFGSSLYLFTSKQGIALGSLSFSLPKLPSFSLFSRDKDSTPSFEVIPERKLGASGHLSIKLEPNATKADLEEKLKPLKLEAGNGITTISLLGTNADGDAPVEMEIEASDLFALLNTSVSGIFVRHISDYTLGMVSVTPGNSEIFLLATIHDHDTAFASMLDWERKIKLDLYGIFHNSSRSILNNNTFKDTTVSGHDARELVVEKNGDTEPVLIYSFPTKNTLVITRSRESLKEVISRLPKED